MNNPNMYTNKKHKSSGLLKYLIIWVVIFGLIAFFIVRAFSSGTQEKHNWSIYEVEYALSGQDSDKIEESLELTFSTSSEASR